MSSFVPFTERIPGVYQQVQLQRVPGLNQGAGKVLLIGWRLTAAPSVDDLTPVRIRNRGQATARYGTGSQLDLMAKAALESAALSLLDSTRGITPEIYAMAVAPLAAPSAAEVQTLTFAGTATGAGELRVRVAEESISIQVPVGATAATVAAAVEAALARVEPNLPVTAGVAAAVVTFTARERGAWGAETVIEADTRNVPGITATVAQTTPGTGNIDIVTALSAALATGPWSAVIIGEDSTAARTALKNHVRSAWDFTEAKYHLGICASGGDLSDAETAADGVDDWRISLVNAEKVAGSGVPYDLANSARSYSFMVAAGYGARLFSQLKANRNFNLAGLAVDGRPATVDRGVVNDAINAGVTVVLRPRDGRTPGQIIDPVSTATTDQTGQAPGAPDLTWAPIEVAKVVQLVAQNMQAELLGFAEAAADEQTRLSGKAAALAILRAAARASLSAPVADEQVDATFELVGGSMHLVLILDYAVIVGLDIIAVQHNVSRAV